MGRIQTNKELVFLGSDWSRPRMTVEREKMASHFPTFDFYGYGGEVTSVQGDLRTNDGNQYYVKIEISKNYPYQMPKIYLPYETIDSSCPHKFSGGRICILRSEQWTSTFSLAFIVAKTAIWLNKYDKWKRDGKLRWPGKDQHR